MPLLVTHNRRSYKQLNNARPPWRPVNLIFFSFFFFQLKHTSSIGTDRDNGPQSPRHACRVPDLSLSFRKVQKKAAELEQVAFQF